LSGIRRTDGTSPAKLLDGRPVRSQFFGQSSFARFSVVYENCVAKCPYPDDLAIYSPMNCGYQTGAGTIFNLLKLKPDQTLVVFGAGSLGFAAIMAAATIPAKQIIAIDIMEAKLSLAKEVGATHTIDSSQGSFTEVIKNITGNRGVDFAIDTTGVALVVGKLLGCLAYGGMVVQLGHTPRGDIGVLYFDEKGSVSISDGDPHPPEVGTPYQMLSTEYPC
jgi:Zn-dependent alcohol dehydrogenase